MDFKSAFLTIFKSLNPESYIELSGRHLWRTFKYLLFITLFSFVVMLLLFIPALLSYESTLKQTATHFSAFNAKTTFQTTAPFVLLNDPIIRVQDTAGNLSNEKFLISNDGIQYRQYFFFGKTLTKPLPGTIDLHSPSVAEQARELFLFLLPSLIFWAFVALFAYFFFIIVCTALVGSVIAILLRIQTPFIQILNIAAYSATIMIVLQLVLMPFYRLLVLPLIAYWVLFLIVLLMMKDELGTPSAKQEHVAFDRKPDIFKKESREVKDAYDVDERGNLKSGPKKKKSFSEENDGYITLK